MFACGGAAKGESERQGVRKLLTAAGSPGEHTDHRTGPLQPVRWSVVAERRRSLRLGVSVAYCGYREVEPTIDRVERRGGLGGLVFTVFVRFSPAELKPGGCVGEKLILGKWVRIGEKAKTRPLFDGSTTPPKLRHLP